MSPANNSWRQPMKKTLIACMGYALITTLGACGGQEDPTDSTVSSLTAGEVAATVEGVVTQANAKLATLGDNLGDAFDGTPENFTFEWTYDNPDGGSATISGLGGRAPLQVCGGIAGVTCPDGQFCRLESREPDASGHCMPSTDWTVDATLTFTNWNSVALETVLNGSLALSYEMHAVPPRSLVATCSGTLAMGEPRPIPVPVDLTLTAESGDISLCGTVAGQPISHGNCP
jgi:hypothetical protein